MPEEFRSIVRVSGTNLGGAGKVAYSLTGIMGVGIRLANVVVDKVNIDPDTHTGSLSDVQVKKIEDVLANPKRYNIPRWLFNRQKDKETGEDHHLIGPDLILKTKSDIDDMGKIRSWKGFRHAQGLKVRGQRTKTTGRKKKSVGVRRRRTR